jgi:hypothetical protein
VTKDDLIARARVSPRGLIEAGNAVRFPVNFSFR